MAVLATPLTVVVSVFAAGTFVTSVPVTLASAPPLATRAALKPAELLRNVVSFVTPAVCEAVVATCTLKSTFMAARRPAVTAVMVTSAAVTPVMPAAITSLKLVRTAPLN